MAWISQNAHKKSIVLDAREIILLLDIKEIKAPEGKFLEIWEKIAKEDDSKAIKLNSEVKGTGLTDRKDRFKISEWIKVGSVAACVLLAAAIFYTINYRASLKISKDRHCEGGTTEAIPICGHRNGDCFALARNDGRFLEMPYNEFTVIQTEYGESRTLSLPDNTKVTLNANSTLRYSSEKFMTKQREVWLNGEAFFAVTHEVNNENFLVHTNELHVEVLGTRFNVNSRRRKSKVVLEEGKVKLDFFQTGKSASIIMQPGRLS